MTISSTAPAAPSLTSLARVTLVLGGARSGKSVYAEALIEAALAPAGTALYLATATAGDAEMAARIAAHRARRGRQWETREEPLDLVRTLAAESQARRPILVDCLTFWVSNLLGAERDVVRNIERLADALRGLAGPVVLVSNEVGLGIVPDNALARTFRDHAGRLHQAVAAVADRVVFMTAGLPMILKEMR